MIAKETTLYFPTVGNVVCIPHNYDNTILLFI